MTIHREFKTQFLECEACPETTEPFDRDDFREMIESAKDAGWEIMQDSSGQWGHLCPACGSRGGNRLDKARALFGL